MRKDKGQFVSLIVIMSLVFVATGSLFSTVLVNDVLRSEVEFNTGDISHISQTTVHRDYFEEHVEDEIIYATHQASYHMGQATQEGGIDWDNRDEVTEEELIDEFKDEVTSRANDRLSSLPSYCTGPEVEEINYNSGDIFDNIFWNPDYDRDEINCRWVQGRTYLPVEKPNLINIHENRYNSLVEHSVQLWESTQETLPDQHNATETRDANYCGESLSDVRDRAEDAAKDTAEDKDFTPDIIDNADDPEDGIAVVSDITGFERDTFENDPNSEDCTTCSSTSTGDGNPDDGGDGDVEYCSSFSSSNTKDEATSSHSTTGVCKDWNGTTESCDDTEQEYTSWDEELDDWEVESTYIADYTRLSFRLQDEDEEITVAVSDTPTEVRDDHNLEFSFAIYEDFE